MEKIKGEKFEENKILNLKTKMSIACIRVQSVHSSQFKFKDKHYMP